MALQRSNSWLTCLCALSLACGLISGCKNDSETGIVAPAPGGAAPGGGATGGGAAPPAELRLASAISTGNTSVLVTFTAPVTDSAESAGNYTIAAKDSESSAFVEVSNAVLSADGLRAELTTLAQSGIRYRLKAAGIAAVAGGTLVADGDGVTFAGTPPVGTAADADGDGLPDSNEQEGWTITVFQADGTIANHHVTSSPTSVDTDGDGLSDEAERRGGTHPRDRDTDHDGLPDNDEVSRYFTGPTRQDTDGDAIGDGDEVSRNGTSPILADTDGDRYSDYEEIFELSSDPLIADVPEALVEFAGDLDLRLNVEYSDGTSISTQDGTRLSRAESSSMSFTDTTVNQQTYEFGQKIGASAKDGLSGEVSAAQKFMFEESVTWNDTSSLEVREESERIRNFGRNRSETASSGTISMGLRIKNIGDVAFTLKNLVVSALLRDPAERRTFRTLATLKLDETLLGDGITLGPFNGQTGVLQIANTEANAALVKDLLADPTGIVLEVGTFDLLDSENRNFAFLSEVTNARTALITVDYGDGRVERYRVATGVDRRPDGTPGGVTMGWALREIIGLDYETDVGEVLSGDQAAPTTEQRLIRVKDVTTDPSASSAWAVLGSRDALVAPGLDFDDILLEGRDSIFLAYITDVDGDGLSAREEFLYRTKDSEIDTDGDGLTDFEEIKTGWTVKRSDVAIAYSDPLSADADRDGLTDIEERDNASGATDPLDADSDDDGLCDGPGTPTAPADDVCRRSNRDPKPLEPALTTPPALLGLTPEPAEAAAPAAAPVDALFDQHMADDARFVVHGLMSGLKLGSHGFGASRSTLRFTPASPFLPGEEVSVRLTPGVRNVDDIALDTPLVFRYRTRVTDTGSGGVFAAPSSTVAWQSGFGLLEQVDVATADWNGDRIPDVVVTDPEGGTVNLLFGTATGRLDLPVRYGVGRGRPVAAAAADFDLDGDVDLAVATRAPGEVRALLNTGAGRFAPFGSFGIGDAASAIATADLTGDGLPDIAVTDEEAGTLQVLVNQGDSTFLPGPEVPDLDSPNDIAAADLDADGRADLVVSGGTVIDDHVHGFIYVFLTEVGTGVPVLTETHPIAEGAAHALALVDLSEDGRIDIATAVDTFTVEVAEGGYLAIMLNDAGTPGTFAPPVVQPLPPVLSDDDDRTQLGLSAADFNGDGMADLAVTNDGNASSTNAIRFLAGSGDGTFSAPFDIADMPGPGRSVVADMNGDARPDLAFAAFANEGTFAFDNGTVNVLLNHDSGGTFGFTRPTVSPDSTTLPQLVAADLDGDGDVDAAVLGTVGNNLALHLNDGTGTLAVDSTINIGAEWVTAADLNDNGLPDLAVAVALGAQDAELRVLLNLGNGRYAAPVAYDVGSAGEGLVNSARATAGDWDGDGDTDLAFLGVQSATNLPDEVMPMLNVGGSFVTGTPVEVPANANARRLYAADVTGTGGALDLLVTTDSGFRVFVGNHAGGFAAGQLVGLPATPRELAAGDLDRDLDTDVVVSLDAPAGGALIFLNSGGLFIEDTLISPGTDGDAVTLADVDGDGYLDAVLVHGGDASVHLNDGTGRFGPPQRYMIGANTGLGNTAAADMDGDGDLDLLVPVSSGLAVVENALP